MCADKSINRLFDLAKHFVDNDDDDDVDDVISKPFFLRERGEQSTEGGARRVSHPAEARVSCSDRGDVAAQPREGRKERCFN